ncbi:MAG: bifunctional pyr operon transcriptional regulator/uracil phosphoribosyltransferase PyrR [Bacilli bacterium]|nr:bifunctional pyr operon transcriptional regulator/uracil phosphoribosyltransferase PyrR [Bacilli bacterium]
MGKVICESHKLEKIIERIAMEIIENHENLDNCLLVGIKTRGYPFARRIKEYILKTTGHDLYVDSLDISFYRDDKKESDPYVKSLRIHSVTDKDIILFDDVISTSRTIRAAMQAVFELGRPKTLSLACLIDKGNRELPIEPNYLGLKYITRENEKIGMKLKEIDGEDLIYLIEKC